MSEDPMPDLNGNNYQSWLWMLNFSSELFNYKNQNYRQPLYNLIKQLSETPIAHSFRAGQQMECLLISTKESYGLEDNDPFIRINCHKRHFWQKSKFSVGYWKNHNKYSEGFHCSESELLNKLYPFLDRLWRETKEGDSPVKDLLS